MSGGALESILGRLTGTLTKPIASLAKNILMSLRLSAAMSGIDKKMHRYRTTAVFSNEEMNDMVKLVKALEDAGVLMKGSTKTLQNDVKKKVLYQFCQCC